MNVGRTTLNRISLSVSILAVSSSLFIGGSSATPSVSSINNNSMGKGSSGGTSTTAKKSNINKIKRNSACTDGTSTIGTSSKESCQSQDLSNIDPNLPTIIVFDLDDCLWTPEMHELSGLPTIPVEGPLDPNNVNDSPLGVTGMRVPSRRQRRGGWGGFGDNGNEEVVELYPGARLALRELALNPKYSDVQVAVASTSLEPSYSRACINGIEIVEGVMMKDMISYAQIGRSGNLTSRKTSHFRLIHQESGGVPYEDMLFFDDCNWGDHVGDLNREFGVVGVRTPNGLKLEEFHHGLEKFRANKRERNGG